jgi:hypothetical protein
MKNKDRHFQLKVMGWVAIALPLLAIIFTMAIHDLPFPQSISETATIYQRVDFLLPQCLGAFALFSLTYCVRYSYAYTLEKVLTAIMFIGFILVTWQACLSPYSAVERTGAFGLTWEWSNIIHCTGAISGFGAMILWILLCFTRSDKPRNKQTAQKRTRNNIYLWLGLGMIASLLIFVADMLGFFGAGFPVVFITEWVMLFYGGVACLLKGGLYLKDR